MRKILFAGLFVTTFLINAQDIKKDNISREVVRVFDSINKAKQLDKAKADSESWFNKLSIRGYVQVRYNGLFSTNDKVSCDQCDKSWGTTSTTPDAKSNNGFFIRNGYV